MIDVDDPRLLVVGELELHGPRCPLEQRFMATGTELVEKALYRVVKMRFAHILPPRASSVCATLCRMTNGGVPPIG